MLHYANIKICSTRKTTFEKSYKAFSKSLCMKVAYLQRTKPMFKASRFDVDYTYSDNTCLHSIVMIENVPFFLEVCNDCDEEFCTLTVR